MVDEVGVSPARDLQCTVLPVWHDGIGLCDQEMQLGLAVGFEVECVSACLTP